MYQISFIDLIKYYPRVVKENFAKIYNIEMFEIGKSGRQYYKPTILHASLNTIRLVRNASAHNERIYEKSNTRQ